MLTKTNSVNRLSCPHARARGAAPIPTSSDADRPAPAGWAALRLLADVDIFFSGICCSQIRRQTLELGIGADADVGFAWSGRRWCRRRSSAASYRVIDNRSENLQHCQCQRQPLALPSRARARRRRFQRALTQTDLHRPAGRRCGCWPTSPFLFRGIVVGRFAKKVDFCLPNPPRTRLPLLDFDAWRSTIFGLPSDVADVSLSGSRSGQWRASEVGVIDNDRQIPQH